MDYLWGNSEAKRKVAVVSWEKLCTPKKYGGLNIKSCKKWNVASVGKLIWQLEKEDTLWIRCVHGLYMRGEQNIWNHKPPSDCSWYWRKLNSIKTYMIAWYNNGTYCLSPNGRYSVTSSYNAMLGDLHKLEAADLILNSITLPRHKIIIWLANQERLLTKERLAKLQIPIDSNL